MTDTELLGTRLCDLEIKLGGTAVQRRANRVFAELESHGLQCRPSIWLSEEWFNPDGVVGFAIPFYLAHPRLVRLEREQMLEAEGAAEGECLRIMRHETGHAVDESYQLFRTKEYEETFGPAHRRYPRTYSIVADSRNHVTHLNAWYAQAHPVEDFAETFAVWLRGRSHWLRSYRSWPALAKLEAVDRWMAAWAGKRPIVTNRTPELPLTSITRTLAQHYREKRAFYSIGRSTDFDCQLASIFPHDARQRKAPAADRFLRLLRTSLRKHVAKPLAVPAYTVDQILLQLISRSTALDLRVTRDAHETTYRIINLATKATLEAIDKGKRLPL